jgi:hypothetical protein
MASMIYALYFVEKQVKVALTGDSVRKTIFHIWLAFLMLSSSPHPHFETRELGHKCDSNSTMKHKANRKRSHGKIYRSDQY